MSKQAERIRTAMTPARLWAWSDLPLWTRVVLYAAENHRRDLRPGELRRALGQPAPASLARAIRRGVEAGLLAPHSTARCLFVTKP